MLLLEVVPLEGEGVVFGCNRGVVALWGRFEELDVVVVVRLAVATNEDLLAVTLFWEFEGVWLDDELPDEKFEVGPGLILLNLRCCVSESFCCYITV